MRNFGYLEYIMSKLCARYQEIVTILKSYAHFASNTTAWNNKVYTGLPKSHNASTFPFSCISIDSFKLFTCTSLKWRVLHHFIFQHPLT